MSYGGLSLANSYPEPEGPILSLTGDYCQEGTITIVILIAMVAMFITAKVALIAASKSRAKVPTPLIAKPSTTTTTTSPPDEADAPSPQPRRLVKNSVIEDLFVLPFVPSSLENLIVAIYFGWFCVTVTMGITRYYEGRWANDVVAQQGPLNVIAMFIGCKGIDPAVIPYAIQEPETNTSAKGGLFGTGFMSKKTNIEKLCEDNPLECSPDIDYYFSHHLAFGCTWLTFGALQIYLAKSGWSDKEAVRRKAHKIL